MDYFKIGIDNICVIFYNETVNGIKRGFYMFFYEDYHYGENGQYSAFQLKNASYPYHFHRCYELLSIVDGCLHIVLDDKEYDLCKGDLLLIFPNQLHSFTTIGNSLFDIIIFSPDIIDDFAGKYTGWLPQTPVLHSDFITLDKILTNNPFEQKSILYHLCALYLEHGNMIKEIISANETLLHLMLSFIDEHFQESCTLQELAAHLGYEYTYLSKCFKVKMKISYTAYLNQFRIRQACLLLKDRRLTVTDIAFRCGYDTIRTFHRNFLSVTGMTPKEYQENSLFHPAP